MASIELIRSMKVSSKKLNKAMAHVKIIPGKMSKDTLSILYKTVIHYLRPGGIVCEIGTWKGFSTYTLASAAEDLGGTVVAIDTFSGTDNRFFPSYREAHKKGSLKFFMDNAFKNLSEFDNIVFLMESSKTAYKKFENNSIDVCFIDGDHDNPVITSDIKNFVKKVKPGGILFGHDFYWDDRTDIRKALNKEIGENNYFLEKNKPGSVDGELWFYEKP